MTDPIIDEIRSTRERLAMASGGDIHSIAEAARKRQEISGTKAIERPARRSEMSRNNAMHPSRGSAVS
jgi:hypothetical protein